MGFNRSVGDRRVVSLGSIDREMCFYAVMDEQYVLNGIIGGPLVKYVYGGNPIYALVISGVSFLRVK